MSRVSYLDPVFVEFMPAELELGSIYVSVAYSLTAHLCACGCGEKVVLPLHPKQWRFTYDGKSFSMHPSVGNIGIACGSHYWIRGGRVEWARDITADQARRGFERDRRDVAKSEHVPAEDVIVASPKRGSWRRLAGRLMRHG